MSWERLPVRALKLALGVDKDPATPIAPARTPFSISTRRN